MWARLYSPRGAGATSVRLCGGATQFAAVGGGRRLATVLRDLEHIVPLGAGEWGQAQSSTTSRSGLPNRGEHVRIRAFAPGDVQLVEEPRIPRTRGVVGRASPFRGGLRQSDLPDGSGRSGAHCDVRLSKRRWRAGGRVLRSAHAGGRASRCPPVTPRMAHLWRKSCRWRWRPLHRSEPVGLPWNRVDLSRANRDRPLLFQRRDQRKSCRPG